MDLDDFFDFVKFMGCFSGAVIVFFGSVMLCATSINTYDCGLYAEVTGKETQAKFGTCYINDEDLGWLTREELNASRYAEKGLSK